MQDTVMRIAKELFPENSICIGCDQWRHNNNETPVKYNLCFSLFNDKEIAHQEYMSTWEEMLKIIMDIYEGVENGN